MTAALGRTVAPTPLVPGSLAARALLAIWRDREHTETIPFEHQDAARIIVEHMHLRAGFALDVTARSADGIRRVCGGLVDRLRLSTDVDGGPVSCFLEPAHPGAAWNRNLPAVLVVRVYDDKVTVISRSPGSHFDIGGVPVDVALAGQVAP